MKGKRPSLEGTVRRAAEAPASDREGKRRMTVHLAPEMHRELRHLSVDLGRSAESIIIEGVAIVLQKHRNNR